MQNAEYAARVELRFHPIFGGHIDELGLDQGREDLVRNETELIDLGHLRAATFSWDTTATAFAELYHRIADTHP